jgi:hypothetical protein
MIPPWKLAREVQRVIVRCKGFLMGPIEVLQRRSHERALRRSGVLDRFDIGEVAHVAIFAIFQPNGLSESTFVTLCHLVEKGYAPIVVSNAQLTGSDRTRLQRHAIFVYERANFGYDFGAFQEIITALPDMGSSLKSLILINDSVWFPVRANAQLIDEMQAYPASAVAAQMFGTKASIQTSDKQQMPILGSYLMMFKQNVLTHQAFRSFWRDYRMSSNKDITIRRGERGLSRALYDAGLSCAGIYGPDLFDAAVADLSTPQLRDGIENMILLKPKDQKKRSALLAWDNCDDQWDENARLFLCDMATRKNMTSVHPILCIDRLGVEVVKKNSEMHYRLARQALSYRFRNDGGSAQTQIFQDELAAMTHQEELPYGLFDACSGLAHHTEREPGGLRRVTSLAHVRHKVSRSI